LRRAKSIKELLPWLYRKGISTGDFSEALAALLGPDAPGLSATTISQLKAETKAEAYGVKYAKSCSKWRAVKCLTKDCADLLACYDFPAEHWQAHEDDEPHREHRTTKTKGCLSRQTALAMTQQLMLYAKMKWRKLDG
jgi:transposase-like protein